MGVDVSPQVLRSSQVVRIDFGKNVLVKVAPCVILQYLNKADISRRLDCTKALYRNEGHSLHFLARHRNVVIYDKLRDIQKARYCKSRAVSSENAQAIDLAALGSKQYLRVEIQLGNSENIRQAISKAGLPVPELTFQNLFSSQICRAVTLVYWNEILAAVRYQQLSEEDAAELFKRLLDAKYKFLKALQLVGLVTLLRTMGKRELRMHAGNFSPAIYELFRLINQLEPQNNWLQPDLDGITAAINENQIITLKEKAND